MLAKMDLSGSVAVTLSVEQQTLVESRLANEAKSTGLTYVLWFFFGSLGVHRFYLGHVWRGLAMLILSIVGWLTLPAGIVPLGFLALWLLLDLFFIPALVDEQRGKIRRRLTDSLVAGTASPTPGRGMPVLADARGAASKAGITCVNCGRVNAADDVICECGMPVTR